MSRFSIPSSIKAAPSAGQRLIQAVEQRARPAPCPFRLVANRPAALEDSPGMSGAVANGNLDTTTPKRNTLAVSEINGFVDSYQRSAIWSEPSSRWTIPKLLPIAAARSMTCAPTPTIDQPLNSASSAQIAQGCLRPNPGMPLTVFDWISGLWLDGGDVGADGFAR